MECSDNHCRYLALSNGSGLAQPIGHPIIAS
jgi:hypothetical protein